MILTLVVPDLRWPRQIAGDALYDANFPALQTLLGKGLPLPCASADAGDWWRRRLGLAADEFAAAPLRLLAAGLVPGEDRWLCADPVHLRVERGGASLADPAQLDITAAEGRQLHESLAPLFVLVGELVYAAPAQWYLRLRQPAPPLPAQLADCIEQPAAGLLPAGDAGRTWRQLVNEAQMALHRHPVNAARSEAGKPPVNSLALWGEGRAPLPQSEAQQGQGVMQCDDPVIAGAGLSAGVAVEALPPRFAPTAGDRLVHWDALRPPTAQHDALLWRAALDRLEHDWLAPTLAALKAGSVKRIELFGFGAEGNVAVAMTAFDLYRFWRKPRRLESL